MLQAIESTPVVPKELATADSIRATLHDSLTNIRNLSDVKEVITGQNPIVKDAMTSIIDLTAKFVPKLFTAILVLWIGFKLIKMLKKALTKLMEKQKLEMSLKSFLTSFLDVVLK
ncbi:MAG: hypothetical protein IKN37_06535, partial [Bacteroidales bacterium]|nr:hypothetical protein [Bacteroidales bacterium]